MSCDNIIDTGKCYIQGDTYNPYVMSISSLGVPLDISNGWTFFVEIKNSFVVFICKFLVTPEKMLNKLIVKVYFSSKENK